MASGSFNMSTSKPFISGMINWSSSSNGSSANSSKVRIAVYLKRTNSGYTSFGLMNTYVTCNGAQQSETGLRVSITEYDWVLVYAKDFVVGHNSDGSKVCGADISGNSDFGCSFSAHINMTLDKIPRYTSVTNWNVASKTDSSITFNWSTADPISNISCNFNGFLKYSASVNTNSGSFTVNTLSEHTTYSNITITVTRKDSGLTTTSSAVSATTNYTSPTSNLSLASRSINSISLNWSSNFACDAIWIYNGGTQIYSASGLNTSSGAVTLSPGNWSGITHGTTYSLMINIRRKASQETKASSAISVTTLSIPTINSTTSTAFNIGSNIGIGVLNSGNSAYKLIFQTYQSSWENLKIQDVPQGTSNVTLSLNPADLYNKCPNSNTLAARVACQVTVNSKTYVSDYYYITANVVNSNPTFSDFTLETNIGTNINSVIGGTQNTITRYGNLRLKFSANSATALNSSAIAKLEAKILFNNAIISTGNINYSSAAFTFDVPTQNIINAGPYIIQILAIDSRGNKSNTASHSFNAYSYEKPALEVTMQRQNNFEQKTFINLSGKISKLTTSNVQKNVIKSLKYRYTESGTSYPSEFEKIENYSTHNAIPQDDLLIDYNKTEDNDPFADLLYDKSYTFQFILTDSLDLSSTVEVYVAQGKPLFAVAVSDDENNNVYVAVDKIPDFNSPAKLQVNSDIMAYDARGNRNVLLVDSINKIYDDLSTSSNLVKSLYLLMHPIGDIIMTTSPTNPNAIWGGTWVAWGSGRVPVGINASDENFNTVEKTGGASIVTLTASQVPSHAHTVPANTAQSAGNHNHTTSLNANRTDAEVSGYGLTVTGSFVNRVLVNRIGGNDLNINSNGTHTHTIPSTTTSTYGTSGGHTNLQPYITCYMWKRTA